MINSDLITLSDILSLGFTRTMIKKLLPEPAETRRNLHNSKSMMKLWHKADVLAIMQTEEFKELYTKAQKRKEANKRGTETKRRKLEEEIASVIPEIEVKIMSNEEVVNRAIESWNAHQMQLGTYEYARRSDIEKATLDRWVVNYIRHELVCLYDCTTHNMYGRTGRHDVYMKFKGLILDRIAQVYPNYADECQRQKLQFANNVC